MLSLPTTALLLLAAATTPALTAPAPAAQPSDNHYAAFFTGPNCSGTATTHIIRGQSSVNLKFNYVSVLPSRMGDRCHLRYCSDYSCKAWIADKYDVAPNGECSSTVFAGLVAPAAKVECW